MTKTETEVEIRKSLADFEAWRNALTLEEQGETMVRWTAFIDAFMEVYAPLAESLDWEQEIVELPLGEVVRQDDPLAGLGSGVEILEW